MVATIAGDPAGGMGPHMDLISATTCPFISVPLLGSLGARVVTLR